MFPATIQTGRPPSMYKHQYSFLRFLYLRERCPSTAMCCGALGCSTTRTSNITLPFMVREKDTREPREPKSNFSTGYLMREHCNSAEDLPPFQAAFDVLRHSPDLVEVVGIELCNSMDYVEQVEVVYTAPWYANILVRMFLTASSSVSLSRSTRRRRWNLGAGGFVEFLSIS